MPCRGSKKVKNIPSPYLKKDIGEGVDCPTCKTWVNTEKVKDFRIILKCGLNLVFVSVNVCTTYIIYMSCKISKILDRPVNNIRQGRYRKCN